METKKACDESGIAYLDTTKESIMKKQIDSILNEENSVYSLISQYSLQNTYLPSFSLFFT